MTSSFAFLKFSQVRIFGFFALFISYPRDFILVLHFLNFSETKSIGVLYGQNSPYCESCRDSCIKVYNIMEAKFLHCHWVKLEVAHECNIG